MISVVCEKLSTPHSTNFIDNKDMKHNLAHRKLKIHNVTFYFYLAFTFRVNGVIYVRRWLYEYMISVVCEKLFTHHSTNFIANKDMNA